MIREFFGWGGSEESDSDGSDRFEEIHFATDPDNADVSFYRIGDDWTGSFHLVDHVAGKKYRFDPGQGLTVIEE